MASWQFHVTFPVGSTDASLPRTLRARADTALLKRFGTPWKMLERWLVYGPEDGNRLDLGLGR